MRMQLHAYICEKGKVTRVDNLGSQEFVEIFNLRPDRCRYAVVSLLNEFHVLDLYGATIRTDATHRDYLHPGPDTKTYPTLDAAIAATVILYE